MAANRKLAWLALICCGPFLLACSGSSSATDPGAGGGGVASSGGSSASGGTGAGGSATNGGFGGTKDGGADVATAAGGANGGNGAGGRPGTGGSGTGGAAVGGAGGIAAGGAGGTTPSGPIKVLIWNNAVTYGHQSRMTAIPILQARQAADGITFDITYAHTQSLPEGQVDTTSNPSVFTDAGLDPYDVVFFLNTTGNTLDQDGQGATHRQALINFINKGRGFVATHSATDTYQGTAWPWYVDFIGANFLDHSVAGTAGTARYAPNVADAILSAASTPNPWNRTEEWYTFTRNPTASPIPGVRILLTCTDASITTERPSAWVHEMPIAPAAPRAGRMFYTAFGHYAAAFQEKAVMDLIIAGIKWSAYRL